MHQSKGKVFVLYFKNGVIIVRSHGSIPDDLDDRELCFYAPLILPVLMLELTC